MNSIHAKPYCLIPVAVVSLFLSGCRTEVRHAAPALEITQVPVASIGGPTDMDSIGGKVQNVNNGDQVVLYAHSGMWWLQPLTDQPYTRIKQDRTWNNVTHLGSDYAALLVEPGYQPASKLTALPPIGGGVLAVAVAKGKRPEAPLSSDAIKFGGYSWSVQSGVSDHGGRAYAYDSANAWTDDVDRLHLRMAFRNGRWSCAEVSLNQNLGYGTYTFVVQNSGQLKPSAVLGMFTWDDGRSTNFRNEMDIELSRWGDAKKKNAQFVVQPFYAPDNLVRFDTPTGVVTYTLNWQPGKAEFRATRGDAAHPGSLVEEHVFTVDVPTPGNEKVHMDLYDFQHAADANEPQEAVIESFSFKPR